MKRHLKILYSMDWNIFPPIYDTDFNDEDILEVGSLSCNKKAYKNWDTYHVFDES